MKLRERIAYIDTAKAICVFLMVVGHWTSNSLLVMYIYSFHMPAFFVISGFLYKSHSWKRTLLSFGVPVAFYSLINLVIFILIGELTINTLFTKETFFRFFHYRYGLGEGLYMGDWFLWALLGLRLVFGDIKKASKLKKYYIVISIIVIVYMSFETFLISIDTIFRGWYIGRLIPCLPFFCLGFYLKDKKWTPHEIPKYQKVILTIIFVFFPLLNGACSIYGNEYGLSYAVFFINAMASTLFVLVISYYVPQNQFATIISKGTLLILGIHMPIMKILDGVLPQYFDFMIPLITILLCCYPIIWLDKWCPLLLGRIKK